MKKLLAILSAAICLLAGQQLFANTADENTGVDRYAVYIGSNNGGKGRERLLYADSDARSFQNTMAEIGGIPKTNSWLLLDPTRENIDSALSSISSSIEHRKNQAKRSELIFYYSGHSSEEALLLGNENYDYSSLKSAISQVPSDIHVVILDSCYSGNFIRTKGGQRKTPFLLDDSAIVKGHAYLSSSSEFESSQESDEIEASYFTNAMLTGLRGAADSSGDNKVSLNELYSYAFNETLAKTETTSAGPQHPNFNITLVGSGDLILSDLSSGEAMIQLQKDSEGKVILRDDSGRLVSEINKVKGKPVTLAVPAGDYSTIIITKDNSKSSNFKLAQNSVYVLDTDSMATIERKTNRVRGGDSTEVLKVNDLLDEGNDDYEEEDNGSIKKITYETKETIEYNSSDEEKEDTKSDKKASKKAKKAKKSKKSKKTKKILEDDLAVLDFDFDEDDIFDKDTPKIHFSFIPDLDVFSIPFGKQYKDNPAIFSFGVIGSKETKVAGAQISGWYNIAESASSFLQVAGISNASHEFDGFQIAGIVNTATAVDGCQIAGITNIATTSLGGVQVAGIVNCAGDVEGVQVAGLINTADEVKGVQVAGLMNYADTLNGLQVGLINFARESNGLSIGLLNFISPTLSILYSGSDYLAVEYQNGPNFLFTTLGVETATEDMFDSDAKLSCIVPYAGIGTRFAFDYSALEIECLWRVPCCDALYTLYNTGDSILRKYGEDIDKISKADQELLKQLAEKELAFQIPSVRFTYSAGTTHWKAFISYTFDFLVDGWNNDAFTIYRKDWSDSFNLFDTNIRLFGEFNAGFKYKF